MGKVRTGVGDRLQLSARFESDLEWATVPMAPIEGLIESVLGADRGQPFALACHEAVNNAIIHAHHLDRLRFVTVELVVRQDEVEARIFDEEGDPSVAGRYESVLTNPYAGKAIVDLPESGIGAWLIQQGADEVSYEANPDGGCLVLRVRTDPALTPG